MGNKKNGGGRLYRRREGKITVRISGKALRNHNIDYLKIPIVHLSWCV